jgi:MFS family permease
VEERKFAVIALFGLVAGQAVVWYTGQFYALFFLQSILRVDMFTANVLIAWSLILGTGGFVLFGALSDRIGRKPIILAGCLIAAITYFPVFGFIPKAANPALHRASRATQVVCSPIRTTARSSLIRRARPSSRIPATWPRPCSPATP